MLFFIENTTIIRYREVAVNQAINIKLSKLTDLKEAKKRQIYCSPPSGKCDLCAKNLAKEEYYIDGMTKDKKIWVNMCPACFYEQGKQIKRGEGQLYMQVKKGSWLMVAGFLPIETDEDAVCIFCGEQVSKSDLIKTGKEEWACPSCIEEATSIQKQVIEQRKNENNRQG